MNFFDKGFYDLAVDCYDDAIRLDPNYAEPWYNKGLALDAHGNYNDSIKCFNEAIRLDPNYAKSWYNKGNALLAQDKIDEAIKAYDEAFRLDPNSAVAEHYKDNDLESLGRTTGANATLAKAEEMRYASEQRNWLNKSLDFNILGKYDEAIQAYEKAIKAKYDEAIKQDPNPQ